MTQSLEKAARRPLPRQVKWAGDAGSWVSVPSIVSRRPDSVYATVSSSSAGPSVDRSR